MYRGALVERSRALSALDTQQLSAYAQSADTTRLDYQIQGKVIMHTFLPVNDFAKSAMMLDRARLGRQRLDCVQTLSALLEGGDWARHATAKMWKGYEGALVKYSFAICDEWERRGDKDACRNMIKGILQSNQFDPLLVKYAEMPWWLGRKKLHHSHRSNLMRLSPEHSGKIFGAEYDATAPFWFPLGIEAAPVELEEA